MNDKYYILAGNRTEYSEFVLKKCVELQAAGRDISMSHFIQLDDPMKLKGINYPHGWLVGNWMDHPRAYDILQSLIISHDVMSMPSTLKDSLNLLLKTKHHNV
jgi:hypothetical protein